MNTKRIRFAFFITSSVLGIAFCVIGVLVPSQSLSATMLALGSGIIGAVLSLLFGSLSQSDLAENIYNQLGDHFGFLSDEVHLRPLRKRLHHYHITQIRGEKTWRYRVYDFSQIYVMGRLLTSIEARDGAGHSRRYQIEAGVRESRVILFEKAADSLEPIIIEIYPMMMIAAHNRHSGIGFMQTWDGNHVLTRTLLCEDPIPGIENEGDVSSDHWKSLEDLWKESMERHHEIFPSANQKKSHENSATAV
jgi:hypothetical protein